MGPAGSKGPTLEKNNLGPGSRRPHEALGTNGAAQWVKHSRTYLLTQICALEPKGPEGPH